MFLDIDFKYLFIFACLLICSEGATETHDLITGGKCGVTSQVAGGVVYSHQPFDSLPPISNDIVCFFTMRAVKFRQKIRFKFSHFGLTPMDCSLANLTIYDAQTDTPGTEISTICPDSSEVLTAEYLSTSFWMTLKLRVSSTGEQRTANFSGFYLSYTDNRDPCVEPALEMMCDNGRCIYKELQCDGRDSCGDSTDERTTAPSFCNGTATTTAAPATTPPSGTAATTAAPATTPPSGTAATTAAPATTPPSGTAATTAAPATTPASGTAATTTSAATTTTTLAQTDEGLFANLTPLYIILSLSFALFGAYLIYSLLSVHCFKECMIGCLHRCFLYAIRRRRQWKTKEEKSSGRLSRKITPEKDDPNLKLENLSSVELPRNNDAPVNGGGRFLKPNGMTNGSSNPNL